MTATTDRSCRLVVPQADDEPGLIRVSVNGQVAHYFVDLLPQMPGTAVRYRLEQLGRRTGMHKKTCKHTSSLHALMKTGRLPMPRKRTVA